MTAWIVRLEPTFEDWLCGLAAEAQEFVVAAIELLEEFGPSGELTSVGTVARVAQRRTFVLPSGHVTLAYRVDVATGVVVLTDGYTAEATEFSRLQAVRAFEASMSDPRRFDDPRVQ